MKDGRKRRGIRYRLEIILALFILAKLCGENKVYGIADWVQFRTEALIQMLDLKLKRKCLPHHSTYRRLLTDEISAEELEIIISEYLVQLPRRGQENVIAIDGKTVRGTITTEDPFGLHLLATYLPGEGISLMQMEVEKEKKNEIVLSPKLLQCLDLRNKVVIGDAMHTQRQISTQIVQAGGDFVGSSKIIRPILARRLNNYLRLKSTCQDWDVRQWTSRVLKPAKTSWTDRNPPNHRQQRDERLPGLA